MDFFEDDISWCADSMDTSEEGCPYTDCFRHVENMKNKIGVHTFSKLKWTEVCPPFWSY